MRVRKAVIPAAGLGTRFLPATKSLPKEMLCIVDKPTLQYIVEEAVSAGITEILIITGRNKESLGDHFDRSPELEAHLERKNQQESLRIVREISALASLHFVRQKEPKGLGHAISCARAFVGSEPFCVLLGDDLMDSEVPVLGQLLSVFYEVGHTVLGVQRVHQEDVDKYGIIEGELLREKLYRVHSMVEKPRVKDAASDVAILGRYVITPEIFSVLEKTPLGAGGELQLTDALALLLAKEPVFALCFEGKRYDVGDKLGFLKATTELALKHEELGLRYREYLLGLLGEMCREI